MDGTGKQTYRELLQGEGGISPQELNKMLHVLKEMEKQQRQEG